MRRVTSYAPRAASPAKTRADAVVVGVVAGDKGPVYDPLRPFAPGCPE